MTIYTRYWIPLAVMLAILFNAPRAWSEGRHDFLFFLSAGPTYNDVSPESGPDGYDFVVDADFLYSYQYNRFRFLAEYLLSSDESELERFKLGWQSGEETLGWIGRFHTPSRIWNSIYHHGQYMQTSISRPLIEQFEDDGGVLPTHITGLMLETYNKLKGAAGLEILLSFGAAPYIGEHELKPFDFLDTDYDRGPGADLRLAYLPDRFGENQAGLVMSWADLRINGNQTAEQIGLQRVEQYTIGPYIVWNWQELRILGNLLYVVNQDKYQTQTLKDSFATGYLQAEYQLHQDWTLYGRLEETTNTDSSVYLKLFPNSIADRQVLGLRFDFEKRHALTLELARIFEFAGDEIQTDQFRQVMFQWSTFVPWAW